MQQLSDILAVLHEVHDVLNQIRDLLGVFNLSQTLVAPAKEIATLVHGYLLGTYDATGGKGVFTTDATVQKLEPFSVGVADAGLTLVTAWAFARIMFGHGTFTQYTTRILLPRILIAFGLINFALPLFQAAVDFNNMLCTAILAEAGELDLSAMLAAWIKDPVVPALAGPVLAGLAVGLTLLTFVYVVRYALLVLLAILAPVAALLTILPETQHFARSWGHLLTSALLMQPLQLLVLGVGFQLEARTGTLAGHLFALAALWLCFKVPGALDSASKVGSKATSALHHEGEKVAKLAVQAIKAA